MELSGISFARKTGIITGGAQGIGKAIAEAFIQAGAEFTIVDVNEEKAQAVAQQYPLSIVIGADTVVELDGVMMGKPKDEAQAREMLTALSDKTHTVHTGIALCCRGEVFSDVVSSRVTFRALEPEEIDRYIASGEPFDKAGGYGIQGRAATMVRAIDGDYFAVMGLPLCRLSELLRQHFDIWLL